jgi:hypothetical protein
MKKLILLLFLMLNLVCNNSVSAQNFIAQGDAKLLEFNNETAKFIVPEGKTWVIYSAFSDYFTDLRFNEYGGNIQESIHIFIKKMNEKVKTDLSKKLFGPSLFTSMENVSTHMGFPIILPEKTTFELVLVKGFYFKDLQPYLGLGYLSIVEMTN